MNDATPQFNGNDATPDYIRMKKKEQEIEFYCPKCGWINEPIKEKR